MADTVTSKTLIEGSRKLVMLFTNDSDGTGESGVVKVDLSSLSGLENQDVDRLRVDEIEWSIKGFNFVKLAFDADTDDTIVILSGTGYMDFRAEGGFTDPQSAGYTGDIKFTTDGTTDGNHYTIKLYMTKKYA